MRLDKAGFSGPLALVLLQSKAEKDEVVERILKRMMAVTNKDNKSWLSMVSYWLRN